MNIDDIKPGDRVAINGSNSSAYVSTLLELWRRGAVVVPCSARDPAGVVDDWLASIDCHHMVQVDKGNSGGSEISTSLQLQTFVPDRRAGTILRTSGSSSQPKSVFHTIEQHVASARGVIDNLGLDEKTRWLLSLPLYHVGGLSVVVRSFLARGAVVIGLPTEDMQSAIYDYGVTHVSLVATQLARLVRDQKNIDALRQLKAIVLGGGPIPRWLIEIALAERLPIVTSYGSTEMASQITSTRLGDGQNKLLSSGKPLSDRLLKIADDGEIWVKGPMLCSGYLVNGKIRPPSDDDGWFHTGDRGMLGADGYLHVLGRKDNMMISGGENIHSEEIEAVLLNHPDVEDAIVVPIPDDEFGQRPVAFVKSRFAQPVGAEVLASYLEKHLARFKIPSRFFDWPNDAPSSGIKVQRRWFVEKANEVPSAALLAF